MNQIQNDFEKQNFQINKEEHNKSNGPWELGGEER